MWRTFITILSINVSIIWGALDEDHTFFPGDLRTIRLRRSSLPITSAAAEAKLSVSNVDELTGDAEAVVRQERSDLQPIPLNGGKSSRPWNQEFHNDEDSHPTKHSQKGHRNHHHHNNVKRARHHKKHKSKIRNRIRKYQKQKGSNRKDSSASGEPLLDSDSDSQSEERVEPWSPSVDIKDSSSEESVEVKWKSKLPDSIEIEKPIQENQQSLQSKLEPTNKDQQGSQDGSLYTPGIQNDQGSSFMFIGEDDNKNQESSQSKIGNGNNQDSRNSNNEESSDKNEHNSPESSNESDSENQESPVSRSFDHHEEETGPQARYFSFMGGEPHHQRLSDGPPDYQWTESPWNNEADDPDGC